MTKYDALREHLLKDLDRQVTVSMATIDRLVCGLPASARKHRAWWANERSGTHTHAESWLGIGRRVDEVDVNRGIVVFTRGRSSSQS